MEPNPPGPGQQSQRQAPVYDPNVGGHYGLFALFNERSPSSASMSPCRQCYNANEPPQTGASAAVCFYIKARVECQCCGFADGEPC